MKKIIILFICSLFVGCANKSENVSPYISLMELSASQQEILDLLLHPGQEFFLFEYANGMFTEIGIWVEVYHYGELIEQYGNLTTFSNSPMEAEPIVINIWQPNRNEFQWNLSIGGSRSSSGPWTAQGEFPLRSFSPIREPVEIISGQEIILYISKFTTGNSISSAGDLQYYLQHPEELAGYTYVYLIKARFTE